MEADAKDFTFPLKEYLARIDLNATPGVDAKGLFTLHTAQAFSIPFENLDIHLGRPILLAPKDIAQKLISRHRGGYCFELNGLFYLALRAMGFHVERMLARVMYGRADPGPKTHQVMVVTVDGEEWLADVGFGGPGMMAPILISDGHVSEQFGERYRVQVSDGETTLQKQHADDWMNLYVFNREAVRDVDLQLSNFYTSCYPQSRFKLTRICTIPCANGRTTLVDRELTRIRDHETIKSEIAPGEEYVEALHHYFGLPKEDGFYSFS